MLDCFVFTLHSFNIFYRFPREKNNTGIDVCVCLFVFSFFFWGYPSNSRKWLQFCAIRYAFGNGHTCTYRCKIFITVQKCWTVWRCANLLMCCCTFVKWFSFELLYTFIAIESVLCCVPNGIFLVLTFSMVYCSCFYKVLPVSSTIRLLLFQNMVPWLTLTLLLIHLPL